MSQYYPQQGPTYPPEHNPETDYYTEEGEYEYEDIIDDGRSTSGSLLQTCLSFVAGGCLMFLCMSFCGLVLGAGWVLDLGGSLAEATPIPGSDIGLQFDEPAYADEAVVNEKNLQLKILEVNRNAALATVPPVEGREIIIVTIDLANLGEEEINFSERDFKLLNAIEEAYEPMPNVVADSLGRGVLPAREGLPGRLVFEIRQGDLDLRLLWEMGRDTQPRYIYLQ